MKIAAALFALLLVPMAWAKKDTDPANYPLQAHVRSSSTVTAHTNGKVRNDDGSVSRVRSTTTVSATEVQIGSTIYTSEQACPFLKAGMDVPAKAEDKKGSFLAGAAHTELQLLVNGKVCKLRVSGTEEAK